MKYRTEHDSMGEVRVPSDRLWGAQTQRSFENFAIGKEKMPLEVIHAFAYIKKAAANANADLGVISRSKAKKITAACEKILRGELDEEFPLSVWQTGSGTQTNMNVNEVVAHISGLHPNDDVNRSQSSNDTFPTAMHVAAVLKFKERLLPELRGLRRTFSSLSKKYEEIIKIGRTHLQDATPVTLGQEISAWANMLDRCEAMIMEASVGLHPLALGATAVGTGLNAPKGFDVKSIRYISTYTKVKFKPATNKFHSLSSKDALVHFHSTLKTLASDLLKIASDIKLLSCGPRCGIGELILPANEPGSSIMPGKVNPTQCEALSMLSVQVMGNDTSVCIANSQGQLQLNTYMPLIIFNTLQSIDLLADGMASFNRNCAKGIKVNKEKVEKFLNDSLMLITCLTPKIGYEEAANIAKRAYQNGTTLREEAGISNYDELVNPSDMV